MTQFIKAKDGNGDIRFINPNHISSIIVFKEVYVLNYIRQYFFCESGLPNYQ